MEAKHHQVPKVQDKKIKEANERWLKDERKKSRRLPLEALIAMQEHKRVFDDRGWDHYLKGRGWDKI